jgi:hypothetical protein
MGVLNNFDLDTNFWQVNPQFKLPKVFREFYDKDKSKGKAESSKIMWAIALLIDNSSENKFRNLQYSDREVLIAEDYLNNPKFNWKDITIQSIISEYIKLNTSKNERSLFIYEQKLEERDKFIHDTKYDIDNATQLDKIISSTKSIFDLIAKLRDEINKEESSGETKGSLIESASEQGLL